MIGQEEAIIKRIEKLKKKLGAVILAHNYQLPEVQDIADYCGDSLELSRIAAKTKARILVFCGVYFMAETAAILSPRKKVILPDINSGCLMADMITSEDVKKLRKAHPEAIVVGYVNTPAAVKAELDYCCTSANAVSVVKALTKKREIIFLPDKNLAHFVEQQTGKKLIVWDGFCPVHANIYPEDIKRVKKFHPKALVFVHPECTPEVISLASDVLSTSQLCRNVLIRPEKEFIIGTEVGILYRLKKDNPDKEFYPAAEKAVCADMKRITARGILKSMEELRFEVKVPAKIRTRAKKAIERMLEIV